MQKKKIGVFTFAITLISLGILLLMRNFIDIDLKAIFSIVWPSIIILLGIEIIITKIILSRKSEEFRTYVDPLSVILLSIIIVIISVYSSFSFSKGFNFFSIMKSIDLEDLSKITSSYKDEATYKNSFSINAKNKEELQLLNSFGNVEITDGQGENIEIETEIRIRYNDKAYADELSKSIIKIDENGSSIRVLSDLDSSKYDKDRAGEISVSYNVRVPEHIKANIENMFGDIIVENIKKSVEINNQHGNIEVMNINGTIKLKNSFGNTVVDSIGESVEVDSKHGEVLVKNVESNTKILNKFGRIEAKDIGGNLNIENEHGDIKVENIKGDLYTYDKFGNIEVDNANKFIKIISNNGNISYKTHEVIEKGVEIENEFGNIDISIPSNQKGSFNIMAELGEIKNRLGLKVTEGITDQSINGSIGNSDVKFYIRSKNGNINFNTN